MDIKEISNRALVIREKYRILEQKRTGKEWTKEEIMEGFVVDVGKLMRLVMAKKGIREEENIDKKIAHELSDCLWSILILADEYDVDIEKEFIKTTDELEEKIASEFKAR